MQIRKLAEAGLQENQANAVNYGANSTSANATGLEKGLVDIEKAILKAFLSLDASRQEQLLARMVEVLKNKEVTASVDG